MKSALFSSIIPAIVLASGCSEQCDIPECPQPPSIVVIEKLGSPFLPGEYSLTSIVNSIEDSCRFVIPDSGGVSLECVPLSPGPERTTASLSDDQRSFEVLVPFEASLVTVRFWNADSLLVDSTVTPVTDTPNSECLCPLASVGRIELQ